MKPNQVQKKIFLFSVGLILLGNLVTKISGIGQPKQYLFDEDLHAFTAGLMAQNDRRAYEWWHQPMSNEQSQYTYRAPAVEWLHPPLAKGFQAFSIKLLGNHPFSWRLPSALAGSLISLVVIILTLSLTKNYWASLLAGLLMSLEHLTWVQSRVASADVFLSLFVLLTVWLYWRLTQKLTGPRLVLAGLVFGLTIASKWSGVFLLPGLVIFGWFYRPTSKKKRKFWSKLSRTFLLNFAVLSVGLAVYVLSYSQAFLLGKNAQDIFDLHYQALFYQTHAQFTHPYQSRPQEWLVGQKPVWYYYSSQGSKEEKIVAEPSLWLLLLGELSLIMMIAQMSLNQKNKRKNLNQFNQNLLLVCVVIWLCLPWFFIKRPLFIYQITPAMPLIVITSFQFLNSLVKKNLIQIVAKYYHSS